MNPDPDSETQALANEGAQEGAAAVDADLKAINAAWDNLPEHIRAAILTLVNSAKEAKR